MIKKRTISSLSTDCYMNPFLPKGFTHVTGTWNSGFVISDEDSNEFVWIPVGGLNANGTLDGTTFNSSFGRRNWYKYDFSLDGWNELVPQKIVDSILKWGGFYLARNMASIENNTVVYKTNQLPIIGMSYNQVIELEATFKIDTDEVEHCLIYGSAYDSVCQWIIQSGAATRGQVVDDSTYLGNYSNNDKIYPSADVVPTLLPCGFNQGSSLNNINDLAGNVMEFTQEHHGYNRIVLRSGHYRINGRDYPIADRYFREPPEKKVNIASFRSMLYHE